MGYDYDINEQLNGLLDTQRVCIPASVARSLGIEVPENTPDNRPIQTTKKEITENLVKTSGGDVRAAAEKLDAAGRLKYWDEDELDELEDDLESDAEEDLGLLDTMELSEPDVNFG